MWLPVESLVSSSQWENRKVFVVMLLSHRCSRVYLGAKRNMNLFLIVESSKLDTANYLTGKCNDVREHCMCNLWCWGDAVRYETGGGLSALLTPLPVGRSFSRWAPAFRFHLVKEGRVSWYVRALPRASLSCPCQAGRLCNGRMYVSVPFIQLWWGFWEGTAFM